MVGSQYGHAAVMSSKPQLLPLGNWEGGVSNEAESEELPKIRLENSATDGMVTNGFVRPFAKSRRVFFVFIYAVFNSN